MEMRYAGNSNWRECSCCNIILIMRAIPSNAKKLNFYRKHCLFWAIWVRLQQPQDQRYPVLQVHAGSSHVSVIHDHRTLTLTLTCVCDDSYARVYTRGLGTPTISQHNIFDSEKHKFFLCSWQGSNLGSLDLEFNVLSIEPPFLMFVFFVSPSQATVIKWHNFQPDDGGHLSDKLLSYMKIKMRLTSTM